MTFKQWILTYNDLEGNGIVGDLANDISRMPNFPDVDDYTKIVDHLNANKACPEALSAFDKCWAFYRILCI